MPARCAGPTDPSATCVLTSGRRIGQGRNAICDSGAPSAHRMGQSAEKLQEPRNWAVPLRQEPKASPAARRAEAGTESRWMRARAPRAPGLRHARLALPQPRWPLFDHCSLRATGLPLRLLCARSALTLGRPFRSSRRFCQLQLELRDLAPSASRHWQWPRRPHPSRT